MASSSDRRSASSGGSRKRKAVYISPDQTRRVAEPAVPKSPKAGTRAKVSRRGSGQPPALGKTKPGALKAPAKEAAAVTGGRAGIAEHAERPKRSHGAERFAAGKRDERERRLASRQLRNRVIIGVLAGLVVISVVGWVALYRSSAFAITNVEVAGNSHLTAARVTQLAGLPPDTTLLRVPEAAMLARLERDPWVADASIQREFPDTLRIVVRERVPLAAVDLGGRGRWLLDATGTMIATATANPKAPLPLIKDAPAIPSPRAGLPPSSQQLANAVAVVDGISPALRMLVQYVSARTVDETALFVTPGVEILVGTAKQLDKKDYLARRILTDQKGQVVFIDVRSVDRPVWRGLGK